MKKLLSSLVVAVVCLLPSITSAQQLTEQQDKYVFDTSFIVQWGTAWGWFKYGIQSTTDDHTPLKQWLSYRDENDVWHYFPEVTGTDVTFPAWPYPTVYHQQYVTALMNKKRIKLVLTNSDGNHVIAVHLWKSELIPGTNNYRIVQIY